MSKILCPSMMCADFYNLGNELKLLEEANVDIFHIDIMDGDYVPNMSMGMQDIDCIIKNVNKMVDLHLMINNPGSKIDLFTKLNPSIIYIHPESEKYVTKTLDYIKEKGIMTGIAINPDLAICSLVHIFEKVDYVLFMTVHPGFAGQKYIEFTTEKLYELIKYKNKFGFKVIVDGAMSYDNIKKCHEIGADGFVLGTSSLFGKNKSYLDICEEIRRL